jgi:membrane protease YdiL (CAAX protease family)
VVAISFGWFILQSVLAVAEGFPTSGTFSDASLGGLLVLEIVLGASALLFLRARGHDLAALLPSPNWRGLIEGGVLCVLAILACNIVEALFPSQSEAVQPIAQIVANSKPSIAVALAVSMFNGLYEETFLIGYLMRGFAEAGASFALGLSVLVRLLYHLYQGPTGAVSVVVCGLVFGAAYWRTRRLWPVVVAHALLDVIALS